MNVKRMLCILAILVALLGWGCSGSESGNPGDEESILYDAISAAIEAVRSQLLMDLKSMSVDQAFEAAADLMDTFDIVTHVELVTDPWISFSVEFVNGITYGMPVYRVTLEELNQIREGKAAPPSPILYSADLPAGRAAVFLSQANRTDTGPYASLANDKGYRATPTATVSVDDFRNLEQYALVYYIGHGCYFRHKGVWYYALLTDDPRTPFDDLKYRKKEDFRSLRVRLKDRVYIVEDEDPWITDETEYAITDQFIVEYSKAFGADSLVYIDACSSTRRQDISVLPPMTVAFALHGVNEYLGWSSLVCKTAQDEAAEYFWSRMLGEVPAGFHHTEKPEPPIRPYGLEASMMALEAKGLHEDRWAQLGSRLQLMDLNYGSHDILLRPQISSLSVYVDIEQQTHTLWITGDFGQVSGSVHRCPIPVVPDPAQCPELAVTTWSGKEIEIDLDEDASNDNGYVVVVVDGRASNPHPLTQWKAHLTLSGKLDHPGPDVTIEIDARFLAEILRERPKPDDQPMDAFGMAVGNLTLDSNCHWEFCGEFIEGQYRYEYPADHPTNQGDMQIEVVGDTGWNGAATLMPGDAKASFQITVLLKAFYRKYDIQTNQLVDSQTFHVVIPVVGEADMSIHGDIQTGVIQEFPWEVSLYSITAETQPSDDIPH